MKIPTREVIWIDPYNRHGLRIVEEVNYEWSRYGIVVWYLERRRRFLFWKWWDVRKKGYRKEEVDRWVKLYGLMVPEAEERVV